MWMNGSRRQSERPASRTRTRRAGAALRRLASTHPADPPPTMTTSHRAARSAAIGWDASAAREAASRSDAYDDATDPVGWRTLHDADASAPSTRLPPSGQRGALQLAADRGPD